MRDNQYFFVQPADVHPDHLTLRGDEAKHCSKVLRKNPGDEFYAVDGLGQEYIVALESSSKDTVVCRILETATRPCELPFAITLAQAVIKNDHFDLVVEKATELGVQTIIPLKTQRSLVEPGSNRIARWEKIAMAAMKQSRRSVLPIIAPVRSLNNLFSETSDYALKILLHEKATVDLNTIISSRIDHGLKILMACGPEGGFSDPEVTMAVEAGFHCISLGSRRLRAETASLGALSCFSIIGSRQPV